MWDWEGLKRGLNCAVKGRKRSQDERLAPCGFLGQSPKQGLGQSPKVLPQARPLRRRLYRREPRFGGCCVPVGRVQQPTEPAGETAKLPEAIKA